MDSKSKDKKKAKITDMCPEQEKGALWSYIALISKR